MTYNLEPIDGSAPRVAVTVWSRVSAAFFKLLLCGVGLALLARVSGVLAAPVTLLAAAAIGYGLTIATSLLGTGSVRRSIGRFVVPAGFVSIVALNLFGLVGTLTGTNSIRTFASLSLVAAPFYLLSIVAVIADVATRRITVPKPLDYLTYLALPFKLLAGPLEQPQFIAQIEAWRPRLVLSRIAVAWPWAVLGVTMKFVIGNNLSPAATLSSTDPVISLLTAAIFEMRFYFDFAGYSFIGYAGALACGFKINQNFAHPFFAPNVVLFWRRWHMSLGRFLARYLLEPNVGKIRGRVARMLFTSAIFLVSAMWHGGTINYAFWGTFHATCYFLWISRLKKMRWSRGVGIATMLLFFMAGRFLAIEADPHRLLDKLGHLLSPFAWYGALSDIGGHVLSLVAGQGYALASAIVFFIVEYWSVRRYGPSKPYHAFRRPVVALVLLVIALFFGQIGGGLLYARI